MIGEAREGGEGNICCWKGAGDIGVVVASIIDPATAA